MFLPATGVANAWWVVWQQSLQIISANSVRTNTEEAVMITETNQETLKLEAECHEWSAKQDLASGRLKECVRNAMLAINYYKMLLEQRPEF
ncbi:MAG: hypothetical protein WAN35_06665 [Terracidiphilus sp.]